MNGQKPLKHNYFISANEELIIDTKEVCDL